MSVLDQIVYRVPAATGMILPVAASVASFLDPSVSPNWQQWLDPWLRAGEPADRAYLNPGQQTVLIPWLLVGTGSSSWRMAHVLLGASDTLTGSYALQLPELPTALAQLTRTGELPRLSDGDPAPGSVPIALEI